MASIIQFVKSLPVDQSVLIVPYYSGEAEGQAPFLANEALSDGVKAYLGSIIALQGQRGFQGNVGQALSLYLPDGLEEGVRQLYLVGLGVENSFDEKRAEEVGGHLSALFGRNSIQRAVFVGETLRFAERILLGFALRGYRFDVHRTSYSDGVDAAGNGEAGSTTQTLVFVSEESNFVRASYEALEPMLSGVVLARDLVNEAPNMLYPQSYAARIIDELQPLGVSVEVLDEKKMLKLGMGGIMAVGQGSARQPRMVIMRWCGPGASKETKPVALVGKGVTFDTGGISLKPGAGMDEMKMDMGGSAAVVGAMKAIAGRNAPAHVVGIVGLAENMPSADAYRPGDVITAYGGQTIEVLNTDAEGRLVLMDALSYVQKEYDPAVVVDLATLTGAMMVALGHEYCGTFANQDAVWNQLQAASDEGQEKLWRMPLDEIWLKEVRSDVADLRNMGRSRFAGSCTAAAFLQHFIDKDRPWAHMDIAGTAWIKTDKPTVPKYGVGFGVRTLDRFVHKFYEADA